ncbi:hypothetical protein AMATHDRAFT_1795 [Amanita thiersii Skay4041]|uniref:STB6-like N-terminal domain-containing protein n=1 Tax=Amanita thiersii Skay4041 TaxID=703135 RepID=A0A2A9NTR5_9AGAR|nr:hypothetical protein AMATHDRAFT_1795 [Amanita thiersii Skay4041]
MHNVLLIPLQSIRRIHSLPLRLLSPRIILRGFQLYAVEKWLVNRSRQITLLAVYTGLHHHILPVAAYTTPDQSSWDNLISFLKRDGARQRETQHGYIMVTSLAHFRSDYTIVHIPDGDFTAWSQCIDVGRPKARFSTLNPCHSASPPLTHTLSDTTKDRFLSTFLLPDFTLPNARARDRTLFTATVLELIKLIQAALSLFGIYSGPLDGLLCDTTVDGIRKWITDIGEPIVGLEPTERIADPMFVSALLSLVLSIRNKLSALGYSQFVPKDPFLQPHTFSNALAAFIQNSAPILAPSNSNSSNTSPTASHLGHSRPHLLHAHSYSLPNHPFHSTFTTATALLALPPPAAVLNQPLIEAVDAAYETKYRSTETRKVRRVIKEKLDDLAGVVAGTAPDTGVEPTTIDAARRGNQSGVDITGAGDRAGSGSIVGTSSTFGGIASGLGLGGGAGGCSAVLDATVHLPRFIKLIVSGSSGLSGVRAKGRAKNGKGESTDIGLYGYGKDKDKDKEAGVAASVRALWSGHVNALLKMREWQELSSSQEKENIQRVRDRWALGVVSDGEEGERAKSDGRTTEEESDHFGFGSSFWGEKMQKTLESWAGRRHRRKVPTSLDLSPSPSRPFGSRLSALSRHSISPTSSAQPMSQAPTIFSPTFPSTMSDDDDVLLSSGQVSPQASNSFNLGVPADVTKGKPNKGVLLSSPSPSQFRSTINRKREASWTTSTSARDDFSDLGTSVEDVELPFNVSRDDTFVGKNINIPSLDRRRSFHDLNSLEDMIILTPEQMRIDVELCGQMLVMLRRQEHLRNVIACLQVLESCLADTNSHLREDYEVYLDFISTLDPTRNFSEINAEHKKAEEISQQTKTLLYESEQFSIPDLWHAASHSRQKVFELRDKVFGTGGRRLPPGVHGARGRFNRLQWSIDGQKQLVDIYGRTEHEVEEEAKADPDGHFTLPIPEEDEQNVVEHPSMKPMWLLRLFTSWVARWGATGAQTQQQSDAGKEHIPSQMPS